MPCKHPRCTRQLMSPHHPAMKSAATLAKIKVQNSYQPVDMNFCFKESKFHCESEEVAMNFAVSIKIKNEQNNIPVSKGFKVRWGSKFSVPLWCHKKGWVFLRTLWTTKQTKMSLSSTAGAPRQAAHTLAVTDRMIVMMGGFSLL